MENGSRPPYTVPSRRGYVFNRTRQAFLATELRLADGHFSRLVGLIATPREEFQHGQALWIVPSRGVHTILMRYPIDVAYLDAGLRVVHVDVDMKPWRIGPVRSDSATVLEFPAHTLWNSGTSVGDQLEIVFADALPGDPVLPEVPLNEEVRDEAMEDEPAQVERKHKEKIA